MNDFVISAIRTIVPNLVGLLADLLARWGLNVDASGLGGLELFLIGAFTSAYYVIVRLFEHYVSPKFGWLLGYAKKPNYQTSADVVAPMPAPDPAAAK